MAKPGKRPGDPGYVGRGHPPVEHRFKQGVSGNPAGRPRGRSRLITQVKEQLDKPIPAASGDEVSLAKLIASALVHHISRGKHTKAIELALGIFDQAEALEEKTDKSDLDESKQAELNAAIERLAKKRKDRLDDE